MNAAAGTLTLLRFNLRRDRIKLPAWVLGIAFMSMYFSTALKQVYKTDADLQSVVGFSEGPAGIIMSGPGYGLHPASLETFIVNQYGLYLLIATVFMNILLMGRHTRLEEETGRTELIRANVAGAFAPLNAALLMAVIANVSLTILATLSFLSAGFPFAGSLVFAAGFGALGLVFAGVTALSAQVSEYSRAATGIASAVLGAAVAIRGIGDIITERGSLVSWLSPIAWSQQTRAYVDERWWPLAISLLTAGATTAIAYVLVTRRDVGMGLVAARLGRPEAAPSLSNSFALSLRLQRANIIGWSVALFIAGLGYGALTEEVSSSFKDLDENVLKMMGGSADNLVNGYLGVMGLTMAFTVSCYALLSVHRLTSEEGSGRVEPVLATSTSRWGWMGSGLAVTALSSTLLLAVAGLGTGITAAAVTDDGKYVLEMVGAHLAFIPAVLTIIAVAAVFFGLAPRAIGVVWVLPVFGYLIDVIGPMLDLPGWVSGLSPLGQIPQVPLEDFTAAPLVILTAIAVAATALGMSAFRNRDLITT